MSLPRSAAEDREPTPDPGSAVLRRSGEHGDADALSAAMDEARRRYGSETSDAWFDALADGTHPLCRAITTDPTDRPPPLEADLVTDPAVLEAAERYAGDTSHDREIADLQAGRHPLLRRRALAP